MTQLLKLATPLVQHHGFTRTALAHSVLALPEPHAEPLSDSAVTALFGQGDAARRTLINAWLDEGRAHMRAVPVDGVKRALLTRLEYNVPVLSYLPEVCSSIRLIIGYTYTYKRAIGIWTSRVSETRYSAC
jgi:ubiquinone biosynthesis protein COQ9